MPPDLCLELMLWDRFGWGPEQTERFSLADLRILFSIIEQQRVSRDAVENLGKPDPERVQSKIAAAREMQKRRNQPSEQKQEHGIGNAKIIRRDIRDLGLA